MNKGAHPKPAHAPLGMVLLLGALTAFGAVSIDLYLPAIPAIATAFQTTIGAVQWSMSAFFAGMAIGQLFYGPLSDRIGRRKPILIGAFLYTLASIACALAPSVEWLIAGRFVQALGACAGVVVARAVVSDRFDTVESARLFSLLFLVLGVAPLVAPSLGALLLVVAGWRAIFLVLALFGLLVGVAVYRSLPESRSDATAAQAARETPLTSYRSALMDRRVIGFVLAGACSGAALFTYVAVSPALFIGHYGVSPAGFSALFALNAAGLIGATQANRLLLKRFAPSRIALAASACAVGTGSVFVLLALLGIDRIWLSTALIFAGLASYGFVAANSMALALSVMPVRAGAISALIGSASFAFGALSSAVVGLFALTSALPLAGGMLAGFLGGQLALRFLVRLGRWTG